MPDVDLFVSLEITGKQDERDLRQIAADAVRDALRKAKLNRKRCKIVFGSLSIHTTAPAEKQVSYAAEAHDDAANMADEFLDAIVEMLIDKGEAKEYPQEYAGGDQYHCETHRDKWYNLTEAADVLRELSDYKETDKGMWEGQEADEAIKTQAAFTYYNAVGGDFQRLVKQINDDYDMLTVDLDEREREAEERRERLEELEAMDKRNRDEYNELRGLRKTQEADSEEAFDLWKAAKIKAAVEATITEWR
jgi:hypothetical protein